MADVYGPTTNHWRAWLTYTVSQGPDSVTVTVKGGPQAVGCLLYTSPSPRDM